MTAAVKQNKIKQAEGQFVQELRRFWTLVKMLLSDSAKISFKADKKNAIIRIVTIIATFALLTAFGYLLYRLASLLGLFSLVNFIPETVPSILASVILLISFINSIVGLTKILYFSEDNRLMLTYPCKGYTVFIARLFVFAINEYVRNIVVLVPVLLSYMILFKFAWFMYFWLFVALVFVTLAEVLVAALLSIPGYYVALFMKRNSLAAIIIYMVVFGTVIGLVVWLLGMMPNSIDVFKNWGPYYKQVQNGLNWYSKNLWAMLSLTQFEIGTYNGAYILNFSLTTLYVFLVLVGIIAACFAIDVFLVNPLYRHLASSSFEFTSDNAFVGHRVKTRPFFLSQLRKEVILFFKNPDTLMSILGVFVILPIAMTLINKIFGAMSTRTIGNMYISVVNCLLILLIATASNSEVATLYSQEGKAFYLNRVYPRQSYFILLSKILIPALIGTISIIVTTCMYWSVNQSKYQYIEVGDATVAVPWVSGSMAVYFCIGITCLYLGHLLFCASLDFTSIKSTFSEDGGRSKSSLYATLSSFALSFFAAVMMYLLMKTSIQSAYLKLMIAGIVFLALNVWLFIRKVKYIYQGGE
jgi:ABC-2 type transport system permease protein